jgi:hypothetical protein
MSNTNEKFITIRTYEEKQRYVPKLPSDEASTSGDSGPWYRISSFQGFVDDGIFHDGWTYRRLNPSYCEGSAKRDIPAYVEPQSRVAYLEAQLAQADAAYSATKARLDKCLAALQLMRAKELRDLSNDLEAGCKFVNAFVRKEYYGLSDAHNAMGRMRRLADAIEDIRP